LIQATRPQGPVAQILYCGAGILPAHKSSTKSAGWKPAPQFPNPNLSDILIQATRPQALIPPLQIPSAGRAVLKKRINPLNNIKAKIIFDFAFRSGSGQSFSAFPNKTPLDFILFQSGF